PEGEGGASGWTVVGSGDLEVVEPPPALAAILPAGVTTAYKRSNTAASSGQGAYYQFPVVAGRTYSLSAYVHLDALMAGTGVRVEMRRADNSEVAVSSFLTVVGTAAR